MTILNTELYGKNKKFALINTDYLQTDWVEIILTSTGIFKQIGLEIFLTNIGFLQIDWFLDNDRFLQTDWFEVISTTTGYL